MVEQGEVAVSAAAEVVRLPVAEQQEVVRRGARAVRTAARQQREARQHRSSDGPSPLVRKVLKLWEKATPAEKRAIKRAIND
jgi:hypothetical protein